MNRVLTFINLVGVVALALLCVAQWRDNDRIARRAEALDRTGHEQSARLAEQERSLQAAASEAADLRGRLGRADAAAKEAETKLAAASAENKRLTDEAGRVAANLQRWKVAVEQRDDALRTAGDRLKQVAAQRDDAVARFNELANKYNAAVADANGARAKAQPVR